MGKTAQLLVTACLGYFVAVACSGGTAGGTFAAGHAGTSGLAGSAGVGLGVTVPDAAAAGAAGGCGCEAREPVVVTGTCSPAPSVGVVNCVGLFPGKTALQLANVRALAPVSGCAYPMSCGMLREQQFTNFQTVTYVVGGIVGLEDGKVTGTFSDGITSMTFVLP